MVPPPPPFPLAMPPARSRAPRPAPASTAPRETLGVCAAATFAATRTATCAVMVAACVTPVAAQMSAEMTAATATSLLCERAMDGTRFPDAKARMQTMAADATSKDAAFARGCLLMGEERFDKAADEFERAVASNQASAAYHFQLGQAYGSRAQHVNVFRQAILARKTKAEFDRAVALDPDLIDARVGLLSYYLYAPGIVGGSLENARLQAAEIRKRNAYRGGVAYAQIATHEKDGAGAARELEALTRQFPDSTSPYVALATGYGQRGLWPDAWAVADRMAHTLPDAPVAQYLVGRLAGESGQQLERGAAALSRYLQSTPHEGDPPLAVAHWRLGVVYERQARKDAARAEYQTALRLDPKLAGAREALGKLR